ncbi:MAG: triose-phosphate isomerase [Oscillospiraceae bacterium]|nr:triose-phosphate isomerase [Oscillospiraceae bacterium]
MNREFRQTVIAGNWKMNMLASEVNAFSERLGTLVPGFRDWCGVVVCAASVLLPAAVKAFESIGVGVGAQNMNQHESGAYTGEVSAGQLADIGVGYAIIGHSERRELYSETDATVNQKVLATLKSPLRPIVCVGESLSQREIGVTGDIVAMQIKMALHGVAAEEVRKVIIAYEPIWAIGTGKTATPEDAQEVCRAVRNILASLYSDEIAKVITIQYGGSMNEKNALELLAQPDIDGGLIGGASLRPESFAAIINAANQ